MNSKTTATDGTAKQMDIIQKRISKKLKYYSIEQFIKDCEEYMLAIKEGRMINVIKSVSSSGMSRVISFSSCEGKGDRYYQRNYNCLFIALGYTPAKNEGFRINGCGMDMIFNTNYCIIHDFKSIGLISEEECNYLAQQTPNTI